MNRFRTKKKVKEDPSISARSSSEQEHSFMGFRRNKKAPEEEKKEIDITNVLPPSDDFRTSLLMTGLSARFSMLREQDDPNTKIGKALDDSVLYPRRQSRHMDFGGFRGLDDIAEVESIRAPPPFFRTNSYASDTDSIQDSVMNRTRPTEGNNLFGGRQKIYRIPASATSSKNVAEGGMGGRALYESDVALSAFQKLRQEKKEQFLDYDYDAADTANGATTTRAPLLSADVYDPSSGYQRSESPSPIDYNLRRTTSSTTSSGARNSTAATSVTSQPGMSSAKDWQSPSLTQQSATQSPAASNGAAPASTTTVERTTTRIRRLYEQGLNQDMHEHQSSALSRIDTLTGKRMLRSRTPDLAQGQAQTPSPTTGFGFNDRFAPSTGTVTSTLERLERRQALAKTSATNLRSISPPMSGSSVGSPAVPSSSDAAGLKVSVGSTDNSARNNAFPSSPPLSPPVSDAGGDHAPLLAIQPNDVGKATAMGMFQKPSLPYDESRFAQRQLQLQQGRETPTERSRSESVSKAPSIGSNEDATKPRKTTFLFDEEEEDDDEPILPPHRSLQDAVRPQVLLQRPSDADHPAFRSSALPTPLSLAKSNHDEYSPAIGIPEEPESPVRTTEVTTGKDAADPPLDSPTLGPNGGLSGMVLQHLRSTSNASSVYSTMSPQANGFDAPLSLNNIDTSISGGDHLDLKIGQPWDDQNWTASVYSSISGVDESQLPPSLPSLPALPSLPPLPPQKIATQRPPIPETPKSMFASDADTANRAPSLRSVSSRSRIGGVAGSNRSSNNLDNNNDEDDFASQLASARRRVQERLTTYVESDSSRSTSPLLAATEPASQPPPLSALNKSNALGILRAKSSRGSVRDTVAGPAPTSAPPPPQSQPSKMLGIGAVTMSTTPSPSKQSFEESSPRPSADDFTVGGRAPTSTSTARPPAPESVPRSSTETDGDADEEAEAALAATQSKDDETNIHPGLRAFRNARRELQKRREMETLARHQDAPGSGPTSAPATQSPPRRERRGTVATAPSQSSTPSRDRKPPPVYYQQRDPSQESRDGSSVNGGRSRSGSRTSGQTERDRSGSEASNGGGYSRHAGGHGHLGPPSSRQGGPMRSPGLPGTDIRRSPHMPPQGLPGSSNNSPAHNNLSVQTAAAGGRSPAGGAYNAASGQPSPISPLGPLGSAGLPPMSPFFPGGANASSGPSTPTNAGPRMQQQQQQRPTMPQQAAPPPPSQSTTTSSLNESMKKAVRKNEISEPTFIMSTSRVPTMSLPQSATVPEANGSGSSGSRSRSGSRARAGSNAATAGFVPPLPSMNPLRRRTGTGTTSTSTSARGPRGMLGSLMGRRNNGGGGLEGDEMDTMAALSSPNLPLNTSASSSNLSGSKSYLQMGGAASDNEDARFEQRTLRKPASEASGMHARMAGGGGGGLPTQRMDLPGGMI